MNEFDNEQNQNNQPRPDYYQPNNQNNGTYYTPPKKEEPQADNTYHYSYTNQNSNNGYNNQNNQYQSNDYSYAYNSSAQQNYSDNNDKKPPKKSKAGIIIVVILVVCIAVAVFGVIGSVTGLGIYKDKNSTEVTQKSEDVTTQKGSTVETVDQNGNLTVAGVAEKCMDYCVGITVYSQQMSAYEYFYGDQKGNNGEPTKSGEGSGVIMKEENGKTYILTCAHVIVGADSYTVTLNNKKEYEAKLVALDSQTDIGVLSIEATGLKVAEFADSDSLAVGEQVVAIGCPGGLEFMNSVTSGYISALDRPVSSSIGYDNKCIQTDAAINPGNSGGALFNMQGQVIGINSSKIASTEYEGMGFAVPSSTAVATANSLIKAGYVEGRAKIGIQYTPLSSFNNASSIVDALNAKGFENAKGAMVINSIEPNSDLANKDIKQYDMIVAVNGKTMTSTDVMTSILAESKPGDTIELTVARVENNDLKINKIKCKLMESKG